MTSQDELNELEKRLRRDLQSMCEVDASDPAYKYADHAALQFAHGIMYGLWQIPSFGGVQQIDENEARRELGLKLRGASELASELVKHGVHLPTPLLNQAIVAIKGLVKSRGAEQEPEAGVQST
ncbi:hypothetical protein [Tardiphaga sp.]|jgi:hypothetical protein|uniref:hypothetical protein n=1 Tax=Tardiphaga sp. TaxID=1926292 RepID=UPI0037DA6C3F